MLIIIGPRYIELSCWNEQVRTTKTRVHEGLTTLLCVCMCGVDRLLLWGELWRPSIWSGQFRRGRTASQQRTGPPHVLLSSAVSHADCERAVWTTQRATTATSRGTALIHSSRRELIGLIFKGIRRRLIDKKLINHAPGVTPSCRTYQLIILEAAASGHNVPAGQTPTDPLSRYN